MSEFKGTPGPWFANHNGCYFNINPDGSNQNLADTQTNQYLGIDTEVEKHNANLIAAAPELLSALDLILSYHDDGNCVLHREDVTRARAAIKKALGQ